MKNKIKTQFEIQKSIRKSPTPPMKVIPPKKGKGSQYKRINRNTIIDSV